MDYLSRSYFWRFLAGHLWMELFKYTVAVLCCRKSVLCIASDSNCDNVYLFAYSIMMDVKTARRKTFIFERIGGESYVNNKVCKYWVAGRCNRNPCRFLHLEPQPPQFHKGSNPISNPKQTWRNPNYAKNSSYQGAVRSECKRNEAVSSKFKDCEVIQQEIITEGAVDENIQKAQPKLCQYWVTGDCVHGDKCKDLHSWFCGSGFSLLAKLGGHEKAVTGITLPSGSDKLLSGSKDEYVRLWDCHSGQCVHIVKLSSEIECLISEGPWVFVGLQNSVSAWNFETQSELVLDGPNGLVYALATSDDILFAGVQDGSILAWKSDFESNRFESAATLSGHSSSVLSLVVGCRRLYSGSKDNTIRVWDVKTLQCLHILNGHSSSVTAVLCWDKYLLSGSLDNTLKVWAATESGSLEVVYEVKEKDGILALSGMKDPEGKPILFCSCKDNAVRLYELPKFSHRGRIFSKTEIQTVEVGIDGLFFTGDATGQLFVWKLN